MTVDLENDLRSDKSISVDIALPKLLNFFDDNKIKATFFTVTKLWRNYETELKELSKKHELASHSHTHTVLNQWNAEFEIKTSMQKMKEYGVKCTGFRAPRFIPAADYFSYLKKHGYTYDSSLATYFPGRYEHLDLPQKPFLNKGLIEFPIPTLLHPSINAGLSYLKLMHPVSKLFTPRYLFYMHPWELLEKKHLPTSSNDKNSLIPTLLKRNSGRKAWEILENYLLKEESQWMSCKKWLEINRVEVNRVERNGIKKEVNSNEKLHL